MDLTLSEIIEAVNGEVIINNNPTFNKVCIDTRKIEKDNIYWAIKGENFDGNKFVVEAFNKGASVAIIDNIFFKQDELKDNVSVIKVLDTSKALLDLAKYYRKN